MSIILDRGGFGNDGHTPTLIRSDTFNGDTTFTDDGLLGASVTRVGNPVHTTATKVFGKSSIRFPGTSYIYVPYNSKYDFDSTKDFTLDFWSYIDNRLSIQVIMEQFVGQSGPGWTIYNNNGAIVIYSVGSLLTAGFYSANSIWYHFAWVQKAGIGSRIYKNGVMISSTIGYPTTASPSTPNMSIGARDDAGAKYYWIGGVDEIRVSDYARWWSDFKVPNRSYGR